MSDAGHRRTAWKIALAIVLVVGALAALERLTREWRAGRAPTGEAAWIWARLDPEAASGQRAVTFFAFHDVELERAPRAARLLVAADEAYILWVNGVAAGSDRPPSPPSPSPFEIGGLLRAGLNRVTLEVRSERGVGGLLVALEVQGELVPKAATGPDWRILWRWDDLLKRPGRPIGDAERPAVWSRPPLGRWGTPAVAAAAPEFARLLAEPSPIAAARAMVLGTRSPWTGLAAEIDWRSPILGRRVSYDWGREVEGYLNVHLSDDRAARGLVWFGTEPQQARKRPADLLLVHPAGRTSWSTTEPRRFRYVTVETTTEQRGARLFPVDPERASEWIGTEGPPGVFGISDPPPMPVPAEDAIRRELDAVPTAPAE